MSKLRLKITPVAGALGAEITGIDLSSDPGDGAVGCIRKAWLEHLVIFFRDQTLPPESLLRFARKLGQVVEYPFIKGIEGFPEITPVLKLMHEAVNFCGLWHSDTP